MERDGEEKARKKQKPVYAKRNECIFLYLEKNTTTMNLKKKPIQRQEKKPNNDEGKILGPNSKRTALK